MTEVWLSILGLIALNGFISLAESVMAFSKRAKLETYLKRGSRNARFVLENAGRQSNLHLSLQFFSLILTFFTGFSTVALFRLQLEYFSQSNWLFSLDPLPAYNDLPATFLLTLVPVFILLHFFTQILPARLARHKPEPIAVFLSPFVRLLQRVLNPFVWLSSQISNAFFRLIGLPETNGEKPVTEEEVIEMIAQGTSSGTIEEVEQDMLERVLLLGDRSVASLMTNRIEVEWIDIRDTFDDILKKIIDSNHSLFPVCEDELDKVVGILNSKKFLVAAQKQKTTSLRSLIEPARIIPENMKALSALEEFKANKTKIAVVVDEYGAVQGLLTQSDLFESIIAEHDLPDEENEISIIQRNENSFLIDALLPFEEFLQYFEVEDVAPEDRTGFHSLGGFILHLSRQIPVTGDKFRWKNFELEVVDMDGNRIDKILLTIQDLKEE